MNYRHAFHAGNFADVVKHVALIAVILHLKRKEKPFCVVDTHAGSGLYDLEGPEASRTGEAAGGVGRLGDLAAMADLPEALRVYLQCVAAEGKARYPGSARIAARQLRAMDRLVAIEKHPEDVIALRAALRPFPAAQVVEGDGYARLSTLLPPRERRAVVLIDPPYEAADEFEHAAEALVDSWRRFASGIFLLWFPVKSRGAVHALHGEILTRGVLNLSTLDVEVGDGAADNRLTAASLLIVNAPFGFDEEMQRVAARLAPSLGQSAGRPAKISLARL
jgi:23S rRNA (adenine2030-N6)-methyltransferase